MFSYSRGKSYIAMGENVCCLIFNGYEFLKIEKEIYVDWSFFFVVGIVVVYL